jgi:uncharacterized protein
MNNDFLVNIINSLEELKDDSNMQKNVKLKINEIINMLSDEKNGDLSIKINKALDMLDNISNENNIPSYIRTQIWNIVSMLEIIQY